MLEILYYLVASIALTLIVGGLVLLALDRVVRLVERGVAAREGSRRSEPSSRHAGSR